MKTTTLEVLFILGFGIFHFAIPFILLPNFNANLFGLQIADFVLPGCFTLAILSIIFYITKNRYPAALLAFLFSGGIAFHALYLSGLFPPVIIVPTKLLLVAGIVIDALSILAIYDYYRQLHTVTR
jgi:hypothetical protein